MNTEIINKTMDRSDLLTDEAKHVLQTIDSLIKTLYQKNLYMTSWHGTLPIDKIRLSKDGIKNFIKRMLGRTETRLTEDKSGVGIENRGVDYEPLPSSADDGRIPWYLYWEILWVIKNGPEIKNNMRLLDAGGTSSLFSCYLASSGCEVHSIDLNETLASNGNKIAQTMGWNMHSHMMNMKQLNFPDEFFDHAYSICVFEHLDYDLKQASLVEIARCLKKNGILSLTFDYRNPAPGIAGYGKDTRSRNQLKTEKDIARSFLSSGHFELLGNQKFYDNGNSYLVHQKFDNTPYTFGAIFLKKKG
tara:strand:- start:1210 stop:2118 length:909 start_codon:yes stop_codon:yes gene_type:complete